MTRDYSAVCSADLPALDIMVARRSWRKYQEWRIEPEFQTGFEAFIRRSEFLRSCPREDLVLITDPGRLEVLFKTAYKGFIAKVNPWLPKSRASGMIVLAIDKNAVDRARPIEYAYPTLVGQDAVLWLTEKGIGSVWLAGVNGFELARAIELPPEKRIFAVIVFGKTGRKPRGINYDNLSYRAISRKRKTLNEIGHLNRLGVPFQTNENESMALSPARMGISESLEMLDRWIERPPGAPVRAIELELMIEGARIAPSACNKQPWQFVALSDENRLREMAELLNEPSPPSGMIVCLGESGTIYEKGFESPFWLIDVPIAMSNMTLMAGSLGRRVRVYLDIPEDRINRVMGAHGAWRTAGVIALK